MSAASTTPVRDGLFSGGVTPHLLGGRCAACGAHHFPAQATCPYCSSGETAGVELSPTGRLWAWTAVTAAPPGYRGEVPFGFGVVELPEGIRVVTRLTEPDPGLLAVDQAMVLSVVPLHTDDDGHQVVTFAFAPVSSP